ncbi:MAG: hypothetical protein J6X95_10230, partial [Treponema sp.]|nr:hypothetical protein [Treponema sp.]
RLYDFCVNRHNHIQVILTQNKSVSQGDVKPGAQFLQAVFLFRYVFHCFRVGAAPKLVASERADCAAH